MKLIVYFMLFALSAAYVSAGTLSAFKSDGCSLFPDGTHEQQNLWLDCCLLHDFSYWKGGTSQARSDADEALKVCVVNVGAPNTALFMLIGTRIGGTPLLPTPFRWGYGWSYPRVYGELTDVERKQVQEMIDAIEAPTPAI